ncbi:glycosyltransferase family 4 protein [Celeribacter sp. SCSIO 80788]|uniref:glycosyltransferase family 4 protein n=1 Tax=Celeribacter sp. SCSIO 80788 TaxID=3117013 RepID=UPI003DA666D6
MSLDTVVIATDSARLNGGTAKVAFTEAAGLVAAGYRVIFFAPTGPVDPGLAASGAEVVCLNEPDVLDDPNRLRAMGRGIWNRGAARALREVLAPLDPKRTAIHAHSFSRALSPALGPVLSGSGVPALFTMHDYFLACPNGGFYDYRREEICTRRPMGLPCLSTNCDARSPLHKGWRAVRQAALWGPGGLPRTLRDIAYISETQLAAMRPYLPDGARLHHILNPIEIDAGAPRVRAEENDVFLFIGRLMPEKGALDFARAAKAAGVRAVFLGAGPQEDAIRAANPEAELMGWVSPAEVAMWLGRARALVFPSVWPEPFGLVAAEALSRGVPAIAGRWNAASEMIADGTNGVVYEEREALSGALRSLRDADRVAAMSQVAYARRSGYAATPEAHCARVSDVLEGIMRK